MIGKKLNFTKPVPLFEVKELVKERLDKNEKGIEPTYEQKMVVEYSKKFVRVTPAKGKKLIEDLKKLEGLSDTFVIKVADLLPEDLDELNLLLSKQDKIDEPRLKEILEIVKKYRSS